MDEKMTSGEIAKKAGVSQKAVRLYDEKGLLKPTEYSEGNYRLYDKEALEILEKIVALKQIGFSLEEIRDNLVAGDAKDIEEALRMQLAVMEEKRYRIDMVIDAINRTLARKGESLDWDDVAGIVQSVTVDQNADRNHLLMMQHTVPGEDWYVKVFDSLRFGKEEKRYWISDAAIQSSGETTGRTFRAAPKFSHTISAAAGLMTLKSSLKKTKAACLKVLISILFSVILRRKRHGVLSKRTRLTAALLPTT